jgi:hypothetical protein
VLAVGVIAVGTVLLAWTSSQFSPAWAMRYSPIAVPPFLLLVAAGLANARGLGIARPDHRRVLWGYDVWPTTRATSAPSRTRSAEPVARRRRRLHPARAGAGAAPLPAAGPALRDADRLREGRRRDRLARRRRAPARELPQHDLKPIMDDAAPRSAARDGDADHLQHGPLERAVDQELVRLRSAEFKQYASNDPRFARRRSTRRSPQEGPNPVEATVLLKTR